MKVLISAAETSSDAHGAELLKRLREFAPPGETVDALGTGGPALQAQGLRVVVDARELLAMGLFAVIAKLPKIISGLRRLESALKTEKPDLAIVIDYPDFHFRLAKKLLRFSVPAIYFIPPKVWVWRQGRVRFLARHFERLLCIFRFEEKFYRERGVSAVFVGNPIVDELPLQMTKAEAREKLGIGAQETVVVLMPGSRPAEISAHFRILLDSAAACSRALARPLKVLVPLPLTGGREAVDRILSEWKTGVPENASLEVRVSQGDAHEALLAANAGIIKSGTSTLEAALLRCPHVIVYRGSKVTAWLFKILVGYEGPVGLSNLAILDEPPAPTDRTQLLFKEFVMDQMEPIRLGSELKELLISNQRREAVLAGCEKLRMALLGRPGESPSEKAAKEIWKFYTSRRFLEASRKPFLFSAIMNRLVSAIWSSLNWSMRRWVSLGLIRRVRLQSRVVAIGNIQAGGSGKTPLVAQIAREAVEKGLAVAVLTRGYRSKWERSGGVISPEARDISPDNCGDEALLLHDLVPKAWIGVGSDRVRQYHAIVKEMGRPPDLVVLDDAFQNWRIEKDLEIVAVTSSNRGERLFRDWPGELRGAHVLVWTKGRVWPVKGRGPDLKVTYRIQNAGTAANYVLVTGVGDSQAVLSSVRGAGYQVVKHLRFPDHAAYSESMLEKLVAEASKAGCRLLTTGKDWVKWKSILPESLRAQVDVVEPELVFEQGREIWLKKLWEKSVSSR